MWTDEYLQLQEQLPVNSVLDHLMMLERAGTRRTERPQHSRLEELRNAIATLHVKRDRLRIETVAVKNLKQKMDQGMPLEDHDYGDLLQLEKALLTSRHMKLKDLQSAHSLIAGYDLMECNQGKSVCVSLHTAFEGVYVETYNMEVDLTRTVQISRHNIPPYVPLEMIAKQTLQTDFKGFLQTLSLHLNALAGRKQQISLIMELGTVKVIERNQLCNFLILMCKAQEESETVLCTLEYGDLTRYLPTRVTIESENTTLVESQQWRKNRLLLLEFPVHCALLTMRKMGSIA
ncbi:centromere protein O isoform X1 [Electrophorus electricus]|uniref:centromere protein O isoform X1 n=2 Tax=Electrophorus electricus TaxID=8005 RepID=UPI0015CF9B98|nr:centromere protein O isoform X1 [Electrophorus electricus]